MISWESLVRDELIFYAFSLQLFCGLAKSQRIRLRKEIGHELIMIRHGLARKRDWILRGGEANEFSRNCPALVHELVERVLTVGARLAKVDCTSANRHISTIHADTLSIALHVKLLDVGNEAHESLAVGQNRVTLIAQAASIPDCEQASNRW